MNTAFHISTRTIDKKWFNPALLDVWDLCKKSLQDIHKVYPVDIISFVLMRNHYHLLVSSSHKEVRPFINLLNQTISQRINIKSHRAPSILEDHFQLDLIKNPTYLANCYRYIYQNPVRANVVKSCESYPYSTLHYLAHNKKFGIPLCDRFGIKDQYALRWVNEKVE